MISKLKILYLSQYFPPEMGAPSARVYELSMRWIEKLKNKAHIMFKWLKYMIHPHGQISLFGDSAFDIVSTFSEKKNMQRILESL